MLVEFSIWKESFEAFSRETRGELKLTKNPAMGYSSDFYTATIKYRDNIALIQDAVSSGNESGLSLLIIESNIEKRGDNLHISISDRDFFDKIFTNTRINTENELFNKKYSINSSDRSIALNVFNEIRVQDLFLKNSLLIFNVSTSKDITTIKMKIMERKLYDKEELKYYLEEFRFILGRIIESL